MGISCCSRYVEVSWAFCPQAIFAARRCRWAFCPRPSFILLPGYAYFWAFFALSLFSYFSGVRVLLGILPAAYFHTFIGYACFWAFCPFSPQPIFILLSGKTGNRAVARMLDRFIEGCALSPFSYFFRVIRNAPFAHARSSIASGTCDGALCFQFEEFPFFTRIFVLFFFSKHTAAMRRARRLLARSRITGPYFHPC